jgi:hypothetical protein
MPDNDQLGFTRFVPGFDFLQNLAKGTALPQMPNLSNWVAPTLNVEELEKRIEELKAVHFWLDQNSKALGATIQALEVQKMTLATLKGMNFSMGDMANALKLKAADTVADGMQRMSEAATATRSAAKKVTGGGKAKEAPAGVVDPLQWWGALTQQFQQIAADAMKDAARNTAIDTARNMAAGMAKGAATTAAGMVRAATGGGKTKAAPARKKPARKTASRKSAGKSTGKSTGS